MIKYPIRINKYLAFQKICSRREADILIENGLVTINGEKAKLGDQVHKNDRVSADTTFLTKRQYIIFNKPRNVVTHSPQNGEKEIADFINLKEKVSPIGRLDKDSRGLIILSNDGRLTDLILNPDKNHEKEYIVKTDKAITNKFLQTMNKGVVLDDGYKTKPVIITPINSNTFKLILTEGKNRQIRRMCKVLGYRVEDLQRIRIMNITLGNLQEGKYKKIDEKQLKNLLFQLNKQAAN